MTEQAILYPRQRVPALEIKTLDSGLWRLSDQHPEHFTLIVFYRGLHCPVCAAQLQELERLLPEFEQRGVSVIAISSDSEDRAAQSRSSWELDRLTIGYGLDLEQGRRWGLFVSTSRGKTSTGVEEPALFTEPAVYLVRPDGTLYFGSVQTMPFARPHFRDVLKALDFVIAKNYPARGEVTNLAAARAGVSVQGEEAA